MFSVGGIIGGAFGLVRQRPLAVLAWAVIYAAVTGVMLYAMRPFLQMQAAAVGAAPAQAQAQMLGMLGRLFLIELLMFVVFTVLMTAAQRSVLRPAQSAFAYLRFGMDELRMFALGLLLLVGSYIAFVVATMIVVLLLAAVAAAAGVAATGIIMALAMLAVFAAFVFLGTRLALAFPLTLLRRKIIIGESWRLTRGRFWSLFGALVSIFLLLMVLWIVVAAALQGAYWSQVVHAAGNPQAMQDAMTRQAAAQLALSPMMIVGWLIAGLVGGISVALFGGAVATAVRLLIDDNEKMAETFA